MRTVGIEKKGEYWLFRWDEGNESLLMKLFLEMAADPNHPIEWSDTAIMSYQMGRNLEVPHD